MLLTLPALLPLLRGGFFLSHDGALHIYRLAALDQAVRSGVLYPRWFPEFAFGYGHPVLNFYGPLSYYLGLPSTLLGADAALALKLVLATGLIASAYGMWLFARLYLTPAAATAAAVVYAYLPYHLLDLYVRGAVAEFLAMAWLPLVLWAFHRTAEEKGHQGLAWAVLAGLLLAALMATHSLSTWIFAPLLVVYIAILLSRRRDRTALGRVAVALALAAAASAFHWLPILVESGYVGLGHSISQGYRDHLLPLASLVSFDPAYRYAADPGTPITFPLGWLQALVLLAALSLLLDKRRHPERVVPLAEGDSGQDGHPIAWVNASALRWAVIFFLVVGALSAFMLTRASLLVWQAFEGGLAFMQYPWRLSILTALATAFLAGALWDRWAVRAGRAGAVLGGVLLFIVGAWALWHLPVTPIDPDVSSEAMWQADRESGQVGATWTGEYLPIWVGEQRWAISHPLTMPDISQAPAQAAVSSPAAQKTQLTGIGPTRYELTLEAPQDTTLGLHQFYYPGWQARWQGRTFPGRPAGDLGLAAFDLPPGSGRLSLRLALTPAQFWASCISLVTLVGAGAVLVMRSRGLDRKSALKLLLLAVACFLPASILIGHLALPNGYTRPVQPVNANLENVAELLAFTTDRPDYHPGDTVAVTLYWRGLSSPERDYKAFVHLTDASLTRQPAQHDGDPGGGFTPTTRWLPGELVPDTHRLTLPGDLPPGRYALWAGLYEYETVRNLAVSSAGVQTADGRVYLGEIGVSER